MSKQTPLILSAIVGLLVVAAGALFAVQNSSRTTQLSFDLGVAAWQLAEPVSVPILIGITLGVGFVLGMATVGVLSALRSRRRTNAKRDLEESW